MKKKKSTLKAHFERRGMEDKAEILSPDIISIINRDVLSRD